MPSQMRHTVKKTHILKVKVRVTIGRTFYEIKIMGVWKSGHVVGLREDNYGLKEDIYGTKRG